MHNSTPRDLDWLLKGVLPTPDDAAVIRPARWLSSENPLTEETDGQNFSQAVLQMIRKWLSWKLVLSAGWEQYYRLSTPKLIFLRLNHALRRKESIPGPSLNALYRLFAGRMN